MKRAKIGTTEAVENLRRLVQSTAAFQPHLRPDEPDWERMVIWDQTTAATG